MDTENIPSWRLDKRCACVQRGCCKAVVDLERPGEGLRAGGFDDLSEDTHLLGVEFDDAQAAALDPNVEFLTRQGDVVATYPETDSRRTRLQIYWRLLPDDLTGISRVQSLMLAVEVQISVQTSSLEIAPVVSTRSRITAAGTAPSDEPQEYGLPSTFDFHSEALQIYHPAGGCLIICPLAGAESCYIEMVHPADYQSTELHADREGVVRWKHHLLAGRLEKGVILRARVRGLLLEGRPDARELSAALDSFVSAAPPLTV